MVGIISLAITIVPLPVIIIVEPAGMIVPCVVPGVVVNPAVVIAPESVVVPLAGFTPESGFFSSVVAVVVVPFVVVLGIVMGRKAAGICVLGMTI